MYFQQKGISLLEVLVGFVIFTSSLVAVLDYVSGQVYHNHLSSETQHKVQMIYDLSEISELGIEQQLIQAAGNPNFDWTVTSSVMDSFTLREQKKILQRSKHEITNGANPFEWTVLNIAEVD